MLASILTENLRVTRITVKSKNGLRFLCNKACMVKPAVNVINTWLYKSYILSLGRVQYKWRDTSQEKRDFKTNSEDKNIGPEILHLAWIALALCVYKPMYMLVIGWEI